MKRVIVNLYQAIVKMIDHDGIEHSGYMSFMVLLSIFPFFVFILAFTGFFGASELGEKFIQLALENMPAQSIDSIRNRIKELMTTPPQGLLTLAIVGSIWTSSSFVECLRTILNRVYQIKSPPNYFLRRMLSIAQFLFISTMISLTMLLLIIIPIGLQKLPSFMRMIEDYKTILNFSRYLLIFLSLFITVCSLYYLIPNVKLKFSEVIPGAFLSVLLWILSGYLLSTYLFYYNQLNIIYGSLGSIIVTLIFFYIVNMIFILGAEFNYLMKHNTNGNS
ncbi:MAG: YihY/virulence factor BrkB family protein [Candidatus Megaira endosymbiont of Carteria cerasiformis]|nr:YihY/virulence factor BrkB family protein [Candidatus Megaera polyxenophila]MCC8461069.1 YihY/virulence factor BrkB family protein [Candidatus Megaera polyxenophila]